jgi:hypothetical protein
MHHQHARIYGHAGMYGAFWAHAAWKIDPFMSI